MNSYSYPVDILTNYLTTFYPGILNALLKFLAALVIFVLGWIFALTLKLLVELFLDKVKIKNWFDKFGFSKYFTDFSWEDGINKVVSEIVFWLVFLVFLMSSFDILGLNAVSSFISQVLNYIPKAVAGAFIILAGFVFGEITRKFVLGFVKGLEKKNANLVSSFVKWSIVIFAFLTAFNVWGLAVEIVNTLVMGFVLFLSLTGGLAFGLGGQEFAKEILEDLRKTIKS